MAKLVLQLERQNSSRQAISSQLYRDIATEAGCSAMGGLHNAVIAGATNLRQVPNMFGRGTDTADHSNTPQYENVVPDLTHHPGNVSYDVAQQVLKLERQGKGRKVISMSLYGNDTRYTYGAVENAMLVKRGWPGWTAYLRG